MFIKADTLSAPRQRIDVRIQLCRIIKHFPNPLRDTCKRFFKPVCAIQTLFGSQIDALNPPNEDGLDLCWMRFVTVTATD